MSSGLYHRRKLIGTSRRWCRMMDIEIKNPSVLAEGFYYKCMGISLLRRGYGGNFDVGVQWQVMNGDADPGGEIVAKIPAVHSVCSGIISHRFEIDSDVDEVIIGKSGSL